MDLSLTFPTVKLLDFDEAILEASTNPFATVVLAHRAAQATRHDAERRAAYKFNLTKRLYRLGYSREGVVRLHRFINWLVMYMSYPERVGHAQGVIEGRAEGTISGIATALEIRFGEEGLAFLTEVRQVRDLRLLQAILERTKTAATPDEVRAIYADAE